MAFLHVLIPPNRTDPWKATEEREARNQLVAQGWVELPHSKIGPGLLYTADEVAAHLNHGGQDYLPVDHGSNRAPRYEVVRAWKVGDPVSKTFNGDSYPVGYIVQVSAGKQYRVVAQQDKAQAGHETPEGARTVFYRRGNTSLWLETQPSGFHLILGHVSETNWER